MAEAILALGSNMGEKTENLKRAINAINTVPFTKVLDVSKFYETLPFEVPDEQDNYVNCCVKVETELSSRALLGVCLGIEAAMGRKREYRFSSRLIDIDLLLYEDENKNTSELTLPHPRIKERAFVLVPLNDICHNKSFYNFDFSKEFDQIYKEDVKVN